MINNEEDYVKMYKKAETDIKRRISSDMVETLGLDNILYSTVHAMVCECIDRKIPRDRRREFIISKINKELDKWLD